MEVAEDEGVDSTLEQSGFNARADSTQRYTLDPNQKPEKRSTNGRKLPPRVPLHKKVKEPPFFLRFYNLSPLPRITAKEFELSPICKHAHLASGFPSHVTPHHFANQKLRNAVQTSRQRLLGEDVCTATVGRCVRWLRYAVAAMENRVVSPGPYRATKLWNEVTKYFRAQMPQKKHRQHFRKYGNCFTAAEAVDWLHELLRNNINFGPEVTRQQTIQLLRKFLKNHVIEDIKGRWGSENLDDNHNLYRFPSASPVKILPRRYPLKETLHNIPQKTESMLKLPQYSKRTPKKHDLQECQNNKENLKCEDDKKWIASGKQITQADIEEVWRSIVMIHLQTILSISSLEDILHPAQIIPHYIIYNMTNTSKHGVVLLQDKSEDFPHWVLSAMKCLANWPRCNDLSQPTYTGFERDVFKTVADYFLSLPEPLLTFQYYELFVKILVLCGYITIPNRSSGNFGIQNDLLSEYMFSPSFFMLTGRSHVLQPHSERVATEALQICCLLLPPPNRRKLQLLMRMISRMSENVDMPRLHDSVGTRSLMIQTFSRCILCCEEEVDLDEWLAIRLVSFLMDHQQEILEVPIYLQVAVQEHIETLKTTQLECLEEELSTIFPSYSYCMRITSREFDEQKISVSQAAVAELLENIIKDRNLSLKEKKKKLKQFQKEYPEIYRSRFPTSESEAIFFDHKPTIKKPMLNLRKSKHFSMKS
ncbi:DEP domain-containing protein 1A [Crotalus adamanteus]|uniref:DEP domain-containing protein 1A n=1 Tax=Crotalus adamanteus TaxID=8729 RepID=A0AAW1BQV6_CROAD